MTVFGALSDRARRLLLRRQAFRACFMDETGGLSKDGAAVMRDLARYCGAYRTSFKVSPITRSADPVAMAFAEGRRDVFLRLQAMIKLPEEEFLRSLEDESP